MMRRVPGHFGAIGLPLLLALWLGLLGCQPTDERAEGTVDAWLGALTDEDSIDRGWTHLHPRAQATFDGGVDEYLELVADSDLESLEWSVVEPTTGRDGFHAVHVDFSGGEKSVPDFLVERLLVQFPPGAPDDEGVVTVHFGEGAGIVTP